MNKNEKLNNNHQLKLYSKTANANMINSLQKWTETTAVSSGDNL